MAVTRRPLHQIIIGALRGDAIAEQAFLYRGWLRELGCASEIFAEHIDPSVRADVRPFVEYRPSPDETHVIYHHSIGSAVVEALQAMPVRLIMVYHNVTPPHFFETHDPRLAEQMRLGQTQVAQLRERVTFAMADSEFNQRELLALGYAAARTGVVPLPVDERAAVAPDATLAHTLAAHPGPTLLFVGRLAPNKRQEDLIKLLYYYRRIEPQARLILAGTPWVREYAAWLKDFARDLGLAEAVLFTGYIPRQEALMAYYHAASVYVSMSEHEGFGRPLVESMYMGLPVLAYAAAAVPDTLGEAGLLFRQKHFEPLAEVVHMLVTDTQLCMRVIARQRARAENFLLPNVHQQWLTLLAGINIGR